MTSLSMPGTRLRVIAAFTLLAVAMPFATAADKNKKEEDMKPPASMVVYENVLGQGWENWSWAKTELGLEITGSPRRPIKVEAEGWQALYLHHEPFNTQGLRRLGFLIQGSTPDKEVRVFMLSDGKPNGEGKVVKFSNTGWTKVEIPLAVLDSADKLIDGIWLQNPTPDTLPKFYVTEIRLD